MSMTGGTRLGMTIARANWRAVQGATARSIAPSRKWTCQSSGRRSVSMARSARVSGAAHAVETRRADGDRRPGCAVVEAGAGARPGGEMAHRAHADGAARRAGADKPGAAHP